MMLYENTSENEMEKEREKQWEIKKLKKIINQGD